MCCEIDRNATGSTITASVVGVSILEFHYSPLACDECHTALKAHCKLSVNSIQLSSIHKQVRDERRWTRRWCSRRLRIAGSKWLLWREFVWFLYYWSEQHCIDLHVCIVKMIYACTHGSCRMHSVFCMQLGCWMNVECCLWLLTSAVCVISMFILVSDI